MPKIKINLAKLVTMLFTGLLFFTQSVALEKSIFAFVGNLQNGNSIGGVIFGQNQNPVSDVNVELQDEYSRTVSRLRTDGSGRFIFRRLAAGRYSVKVTSLNTDYEEQTQSVEIVNAVITTTSGSTRTLGSENLQLDFYLRLRRSANSNIVNQTIFVQDVPETAKELYKKAISALDKKNFEEAISFLQDSLKLFPDYYLALEVSGKEYFKLQQFENAKTMFSKAVVINPRSYVAWYLLAYSNFALRQFKESLACSNKAIELDSTSVEATLLNGLAMFRLEKYEEAEKLLLKADKLAKGTNTDIHWQLALLYGKSLKKYDLAADQLEIFLKLQPNGRDTDKILLLIKDFRAKAKKQ